MKGLDLFQSKNLDANEFCRVLLHFLGSGSYKDGNVVYSSKQAPEKKIEIQLTKADRIYSITVDSGFPKHELAGAIAKVKTALIDDQRSITGRIVAFCEYPISGYFKGDFFQILPMPQGAPTYPRAPYPFLLEFTYCYSKDWIVNDLRRRATAKKLSALLSVFTGAKIMSSSEIAKYGWYTIYNDNSRPMPHFGELGYFFIDMPNEEVFSDTSKLKRLRVLNTQRSSGQLGLAIPQDLNGLMNKAQNLENPKHNQFHNACLLTSFALENTDISRSIEYLALICAIESLISFTDKCTECDQYKGATKQFKQFVNRYSTDADTKQSAAKFYDQRSKISHGSQLMGSDIEPDFLNWKPSIEEQKDVLHRTLVMVKKCLTGWLKEQ